MRTALQNYLKSSCVKIVQGNLSSKFGTGFFIDSNHIITCYHCVKDFIQNDEINILFNNEKFHAEYIPSIDSDKYDVALLKVEKNFQHAFLLDDEIDNSKEFAYFGFSENNNFGEIVTLTLEGISSNSPDNYLIKFKNANVIQGHSGSALMNLNNGRIIGMICQRSKNGGYAIPISSIIKTYPFIKNENIIFNTIHFKENPFHSEGIYIYDKTFTENHFKINEKYSIENIFINPNYKIVNIENLTEYRELGTQNDILKDGLDILENFKLLLILGSYGTGKTIFSKILQKNLINKNQKTLFMNCSEVTFFEDYTELHNYITPLTSSSKPLYIFFDGYDELNFLNENKTDTIGKFLENIIRISKEKNVRIAINSRNIPKTQKDIYENINLQFEEIREESIKYLVLDEFENSHLENFMNAFAKIKENEKIKKKLYIHDLKNYHKHLKKACHNPLFIYWFEITFYNQNGDTQIDLYNIYESFVKNTINGKFSTSQYHHESISQLRGNYKKFIQGIASEILINNTINLNTSREEIHERYLDENIERYFINYETIDSKIKKIAGDITFLHNLNISKTRLEENVLTCYFLECNKGKWRFKDNNLLFFLAAEIYFEKIEKIIRSQIDIQTLYDTFKSDIPLHPLSIEFLFLKIDKLTENEKNILYLFILNLIEQKIILQIDENSLQKLNLNKINTDILLILIFKKLNTDGFNYRFTYFFKRCSWLISAAKIINKKYLNIFQRFFKESIINQAEFRRINLSGFNFDYSSLHDVKFIQNKMFFVRMNNCNFSNTEFLLCDILDMEMSHISGKLVLKNCIIDKLYIKFSEKTISNIKEITFKNSQIKWIEFQYNGNNNLPAPDVIFKNCNINNLKASTMLFNTLIFEKCISNVCIINKNLIRKKTI